MTDKVKRTVISDKNELQIELTNLEGDMMDLEIKVDDDAYTEALELAGDMQERINMIHQYIAAKASE